jgi:hypothetical protein
VLWSTQLRAHAHDANICLNAFYYTLPVQACPTGEAARCPNEVEAHGLSASDTQSSVQADVNIIQMLNLCWKHAHLLVDGPDLVPFLQRRVLAGALRDKRTQRCSCTGSALAR